MYGQVPGFGFPEQIANLFILAENGTGTGFFIYNGAPALGNPPILAITNASQDPYGNTVTPRSITDFDVPFLLYSAAPAAGNLAFSISPSAGTDAFGNNYFPGFTAYKGS